MDEPSHGQGAPPVSGGSNEVARQGVGSTVDKSADHNGDHISNANGDTNNDLNTTDVVKKEGLSSDHKDDGKNNTNDNGHDNNVGSPSKNNGSDGDKKPASGSKSKGKTAGASNNTSDAVKQPAPPAEDEANADGSDEDKLKQVPQTLAEIPTIKFEGWKSINVDALYFLHACLVLQDIPIGAAPEGWERDRTRLETEVLRFRGLEGSDKERDAVKSCFEKLDKTYLLDFLLLFGIQQASGRTFNRRHSPASLVVALLDYLNSPGKRYYEIYQIVSRKDRALRARPPLQASSSPTLPRQVMSQFWFGASAVDACFSASNSSASWLLHLRCVICKRLQLTR
jgi:hypothetical protein